MQQPSNLVKKKKRPSKSYQNCDLTFFEARYSIPLATQYPNTVRSLDVSAAESSLKL